MNLPIINISKGKLKKLARRHAEKVRRELLIEKGEQLLDEMTVKRIMERKETK